MGLRNINPNELNCFCVSENQIKNFFCTKANYLALSFGNNYPTSTKEYLLSYIKGYESLIEKIRESRLSLNKEIVKKKIICDEYERIEDFEIAKIIFDNNENYTHQKRIMAFERSLDRIEKKINEQKCIYDTEQYEGYVRLYAAIYFDSFGFLTKKFLRRTQQIANFDIFELSKSLLHFTIKSASDNVVANTIFLIRQAIEVKVLESLGIVSFIDKTHCCPV
jgi:hypothetical protein